MRENDSVHYAQIGKTPNSKFPTNNSQHLSHQLLSKHHTHTHTFTPVQITMGKHHTSNEQFVLSLKCKSKNYKSLHYFVLH